VCLDCQNAYRHPNNCAHENIAVWTQSGDNEDFLGQDVEGQGKIEAQQGDCSMLKIGDAWRWTRHAAIFADQVYQSFGKEYEVRVERYAWLEIW
jgi:hypothetical protein